MVNQAFHAQLGNRRRESIVVVIKDIRMLPTSKLVLPYEPNYTGHREAEKRRKQTREWLRQRDRVLQRRELESPPPRTPELKPAERKRAKAA